MTAGRPGAGSHPQDELLVFYSADLEAYNFGRSHPLQPERYRLTMELIEGLGLLDGPGIEVVPPRHALTSELLKIHSYPYLQAVRRAQNIAKEQAEHVDLRFFGLGDADNPYFPAMYEASSLAAGASLQAMEAILEGQTRRAYNMAGGLHHAGRDRASGFCIFNDVAIAINRALEDGLRVAYVDLDAHHGDGVQELFYDEPRVLTISIHESGRFLFPGTGDMEEQGNGKGYGAAINIPLPPRSGNGAYIFALEAIIEPALRAFRPDVLVTQTGCDSHWSDPLTHLGATLELYPVLGRNLDRLAREITDGRWLILGGGGYDPLSITPRAWAGFIAGALGHNPPPSVLPASWLDHVRRQGAEAPESLLADPGPRFEPLGASVVVHLAELFRDGLIRNLAAESLSA